MSTRDVVQAVFGVALACGIAAMPSPVAAQTAPARPSAESAAPAAIRVKLIVETLDGQKLIDSLPIEFIARANVPSGATTSFNHGLDVPLAQATKDGAVSYQYRPIGNNIMIRDAHASDQLIAFELAFDRSSVGAQAGEAAPAAKTFRKFTIQTPVSVRPGQTIVVALSTDAVTHETTRLSISAELVR